MSNKLVVKCANVTEKTVLLGIANVLGYKFQGEESDSYHAEDAALYRGNYVKFEGQNVSIENHSKAPAGYTNFLALELGEIPKPDKSHILNLNSCDYEIEVSKDEITVECQTITFADVEKVYKKMVELRGK